MRHGVIGKGKWLVIGIGAAACVNASSAGRAPHQVPVRPGIDVLLTDSLHLVRGKRVGLVTNMAAVDAKGISDIDRIRGAGIQLVALFAPEHGLTVSAAPGERVASTIDSASRIPIYSLYGQIVAPTAEMLRGVEVLLVDLPDVGARYYTYLATTVNVMKAAASFGVPVVILDRPNPIGGAVQGAVLDTAFTSNVGRLAVPMRHGLTLGEEASLARGDLQIPGNFRVVAVAGWNRAMLFNETGLPFRPPSPNLQDVEALFHYPGTCLFEGTALSVGRGTDAAFRQVGAPWLDTAAVFARLRPLRLPGVQFVGVTFTPRQPGDGKFADTTVVGIRLVLTDPKTYDPTRTAVHLLAAIRAVHPDRIRIGGSFDRLAGSRLLREALLRGDAPDAIIASWQPALAAYQARVGAYLLYR